MAQRAEAVGAGVPLRRDTPEAIRDAVARVLGDKASYQKNIAVIAESFWTAGGPEKAADKIEQVISGNG